MDFIRKRLEPQVKFTDRDWQKFAEKWTLQTFVKKDIILSEGKIEKYLSFIEKGIVRFFVPTDDGNEITFVFAFDGWFMSAYDSFLTQSPCNYTIQALTDTTLWRLTYNDLQNLYNDLPMGNKIGRMASEQLFMMKTKREISLLKDTAEQRYKNLIKDQPHFLQHIPLQYLASYIGITPQALSRIRRRIS